MTRAFIALDLPATARSRLTAVARRAQLPSVARLLPPESLHLTLVLLGDQTDAALLELHDALARLPMPPLELRLSGLGSYTGHALHVDVAPDPALSRLESALRRASAAAGIPLARRRFQPHITIARFPAGAFPSAALAEIAARLGPPDPTPITVDAFALYESHLSRDGARYDCLARYPC